MSDELKIATQLTPSDQNNGASLSIPNTYNFNQTGEGTNIGVAQNVDNSTVNLFLTNNSGNRSANTNTLQTQTFNLNYYNLFVINGESFCNPYFTVDIDCALTINYGTAHQIHERLALFDEIAISELKSYPAIFTSENYRYSDSSRLLEEQFAFFGFVTDIKAMQNGKIKVFFQKMPMCSIPHNLLNTMLTELDIQGTYKFNELDKTHWSVKNINLIEEMQLKGINLFIPSILA